MSFTYDKNKSEPNTDPSKISWARKLFININFKGSPNKYDSNYETTFSENPMYPIFFKSIIIKSVYFFV